MALATVEDLLNRYDSRLLADLAGDEAEPTPPAQSPRVQAALEGASGEVLSAARLGGRYTPEELANLTDADGAFLKDVVCLLALLRLVGTRIQTIGETTFGKLRELADRTLEDLRAGRLIFGTPAANRAQTPDVDGPTALDYQRLNLLPDRTRHYYPSRQSRLPLGR